MLEAPTDAQVEAATGARARITAPGNDCGLGHETAQAAGGTRPGPAPVELAFLPELPRSLGAFPRRKPFQGPAAPLDKAPSGFGIAQ